MAAPTLTNGAPVTYYVPNQTTAESPGVPVAVPGIALKISGQGGTGNPIDIFILGSTAYPTSGRVANALYTNSAPGAQVAADAGCWHDNSAL